VQRAIDLILTHHDVVQPDPVVVADPRQVSDRGIEGAPLLVVGVLSPSTRIQDRTVKARRYAALGIRHYWIGDPEARRIECHRAEAGACVAAGEVEGDATLTPPDWPGLTIALADLWR
jgi:Uma2 family endonuclease